MNLLLDTAIGTSVVLGGALAIAAACRKGSAALRHLILSVAIASAIALPLAQPFVPEWTIPLRHSWARSHAVDQSGTSALSPGSTPSDIAARPGSNSREVAASVRRLLMPVWLTGVGLGLFRLLAGLLRLAWLAARADHVRQSEWTDCAGDVSSEYGVYRSVLLLQSDHPALLVTWGLMRPKIILPRGADRWSLDRIRIVLRHELAHIHRGDWMTQMAAELLRSLYWFNPLTWLVCRRVRQESEQACDDLVLRSGIHGSNYATHLVDLALAAVNHRTVPSPALAIARPSSLERRIRAMLTENLSRKPIARQTGVIITLAGLCVAAPVAGFTTSSRTTTRAVGAGHGVVAPIKVVRQSILDRRLPASPGARPDPSLGAVVGTAPTQTGFASFSGTLVDPYGGVLPGVTLTLLNTQSRAKQEVHSDRSGRFEFVGIPQGDYQFEAMLPGFATLNRTVTFGAGMEAGANLTMQIGSIEETITVSDGDTPAAGSVGPPFLARRRASQTCGAPVAGGVGGNLKPPVHVETARPIYPASARDAKIEGVVVLQGRIDKSGLVADVRPVGSPNPDLAGAAMEAVNAWRFEATELNCVPIDTAMTVTIRFSLRR